MRKIGLQPDTSYEASNVVNAIKDNNEEVLKQYYEANYYKVERFVLKNNGSTDQSKDLFQEAFIVVWRNIKKGDFIPQSESSLNGYLFTIAKNKWMDYLRSTAYKKTTNVSEDWQFKTEEENSSQILDDKLENERLLGKAMQAFNSLGLPCKTLLTKFYFEKKSMKDIANELEIDAASTRNKKYRCMQKLRELALSH